MGGNVSISSTSINGDVISIISLGGRAAVWQSGELVALRWVRLTAALLTLRERGREEELQQKTD